MPQLGEQSRLVAASRRHDLVVGSPRFERSGILGRAPLECFLRVAFVHPVIGLLTVLLAVFVMSRGLTSRRRDSRAHAARRIHRRWAPWALAAMALSAVTGTASTVFLRQDLSLGETWHLAVGWTAVAWMSAAGLLTRAFTRNPSLRRVHPWLGVVSVALAVIQAILGIQLLP